MSALRLVELGEREPVDSTADRQFVGGGEIGCGRESGVVALVWAMFCA